MMMTPSQVRKENPDASIGEVAKILGKMWGEIDPSDKAKFDKVTKYLSARPRQITFLTVKSRDFAISRS